MVLDLQLLAGVDDWHHTYVLVVYTTSPTWDASGSSAFGWGSEHVELQWYVLSTVARPSAFGRGPGLA